MTYGQVADKYGVGNPLFKRYFLIKKIAKKLQEEQKL